MKIRGKPGPNRITVIFDDGEFKGKSVTMNAEPLVGGVTLYADSIIGWDGQQSNNIEGQTKHRIVELIREELKKYPASEIVD